jgi:hypothetical protein
MAYAKNEHLTILLKAEVISVSELDPCVTVRTISDNRHLSFEANKGIILCAGTIDTARIALRSDLSLADSTKKLVGRGLTDHEIWGVRFLRPTDKKLPPLKLQSHIKLCEKRAPLNVVVNADTFFGSELTSTSFGIPS